jgi:hypothetical protein
MGPIDVFHLAQEHWYRNTFTSVLAALAVSLTCFSISFDLLINNRGVMIMVCASLAELFIQYKIIAFAFKSLFQSACSGLQTHAQKRGKSIAFLEKHASKHRNANVVEDPAKPEDQVRDWMWIVGLIVTIVIAMIICQLQWVCSTTISTQIRH